VVAGVEIGTAATREDHATRSRPSLIGREPELAQLHALLDDTRLLTITGSGGCGKTRLALQAVVDRADRYRDGIWFVEFAALGETSSVAGALAAVVQLQGSADQSLLEALVARLRDDQALVVIDNCEHLVDEAALLVEALLRGCPPLQVLTTSRQPLNLPGEVTWRVPSMVGPPAGEVTDIDSLGSFDAVRLFVDRAVRGRPAFTVTNDNAAHVAAICEALDGIPLAIELAAARVRNMPIERIASGLNDRFGLLRGASSTLLPRQQTLWASVEWSYDLLQADERVLLRRLAVFRGGFTLGAAEAVAAFEGLGRQAVLDLLSGLVDRSLVQLDDTDLHPRCHWSS
jgi:non-specific serine/threonine protein kinase